MKKFFSSALIIMLTISAANAQTTSTNNHGAHKKEHKIGYAKLNLTAEQKTRLQAIKEQHKKDAAALKSNTALTAEQQKARRQELRQQYKSQYEAILTPAQKQELAKMKTERKATGKMARKGGEGRQRGEGKGGYNRGGNMAKELELTADQQAKVQQIRTDHRSKMQSLRNDKVLTAEQKKAKMGELMKNQQDQMKAVLTKEQQEKMQSIRKERAASNTK